ncbi:methionyl-tRNA formyltransferase [Candidatus Neomarinimicrobiota bacterium]
MRLVFMGTPAFAEPTLRQLHFSHHHVVSVVTGLDKPVGRGQRVKSPPVKRLAQDLEYPILQPARLKDEAFYSQLVDLAADILVVVAFRILPDSLLTLTPHGAINLHPSLLPRYRGAAPIQHCLLNDETTTGITTIALTPTIDAGNILLQRNCDILPNDDFGSLSERLAQLGAELVVDTLDRIEREEIIPQPQSSLVEGDIPSAPKLKPEDYIIRWKDSAAAIRNQIRAFSPKPGAATLFEGQRMKIFKTEVNHGHGEPGEILQIDQGQLQIGTGEGILTVSEVQLEGRRRMNVDDFLRGTVIPPGTRLGF